MEIILFQILGIFVLNFNCRQISKYPSTKLLPFSSVDSTRLHDECLLMFTDERSFIQQRYVLSFMGFMALAIGYVQRFCLSLAITEMAEHTHHIKTHQTISEGTVCPSDYSIHNSTTHKVTYVNLNVR